MASGKNILLCTDPKAKTTIPTCDGQLVMDIALVLSTLQSKTSAISTPECNSGTSCKQRAAVKEERMSVHCVCMWKHDACWSVLDVTHLAPPHSIASENSALPIRGEQTGPEAKRTVPGCDAQGFRLLSVCTLHSNTTAVRHAQQAPAQPNSEAAQMQV